MNLRAFLFILFFLVMAFFAPVLFSPGSIPGNFGDVYLHYYPLKALVAEHLVNGRLPLWNPYIFAGQPVLANPQSAVFYPFSLFFSLFPLSFAFTLFFAVHIFMAGFFMYLFLGSCRLPCSASAAGSIVFAFSSFLIYRVTAGHPVILSGFIWLPLILLALKSLRRARSIYGELFLAAVAVLQFLSGHAVPFYTTVIAAFLYWAVHRFYFPVSLGRSAAYFLIIAAIQIVPTLQLSRATDTARWGILTDSYSLPLQGLWTFLAPWHFWHPENPAFVPSYFVEKYCLYVGIIPLIFGIVGLYLAVRRRSCFIPALLLAGMIFAAGTATPLFGFISNVIPGMGFVRVPARFAFLAVFALAASASFGWKSLFAGRAPFIKMAFFAVIFSELFFWNHRFIYAASMIDYRSPSPVSSAVSPAYRMITEPERLPADKAMLYHHFNLNGYEAILLRDFTRYLGLQEKKVLSPTGLARADLASPTARGLAAAYRVTADDVPGMVPLASFGSVKVYPIPDALPRVFIPRRLKIIPESDKQGQLDYLSSTPYTPAEECLLDSVPETFPAFSPGGKILSIHAASSKLAVDLSLEGPSALVFSEIAFSGWKAASGGKKLPVVRANKSLRAVLLPGGDYRGSQRVYLYFFPEIVLFGIYITLFGLIAALGYIVLKARKDKGAWDGNEAR